MSRRCLPVLLLLLFLLPTGAWGEDPAVGAVVKESPGAIGEVIVRLQDGHTVKRGDVLVLRREGQQTPLGEAFVLRTNGNDAVVSLKGMFDVKPGDGVFFGRRPAPVAAAPAPAPAASSPGSKEEDPEIAELERELEELEASSASRRGPLASSSSIAPALVKDPNGHYAIKIPAGWNQTNPAQQPEAVLLIGPAGEAIFLHARNSGNATGMFEDPDLTSFFVAEMRRSMSARRIEVSGETRVTMFGMAGLKMNVKDFMGNTGFAVFLPGSDHLVTIVLMAPTPAGVKTAEAVLKKLKFR